MTPFLKMWLLAHAALAAMIFPLLHAHRVSGGTGIATDTAAVQTMTATDIAPVLPVEATSSNFHFTVGDSGYTTVSYTATQTRKDEMGRTVPVMAFSATNKDPSKAYRDVLNDLINQGYDPNTKLFKNGLSTP